MKLFGFLQLAALCVLAPAAVVAQEDPAQARSADGPVPAWVQQCDEGTCQLSRGITETNSGKQVVALSVVLQEDQDEGRLVLMLPLGIALEQGVTIRGERDFRTLPLATCTPDGCIAETVLDATNLDLFASQSGVEIGVTPYNRGEKLELMLPLSGLPDAIAEARGELEG